MKTRTIGLVACFLYVSGCLWAAQFKGTVTDPSGAPVPGAQISIVDRVGVRAQTVAADSGAFEIVTAGALPAGAHLIVTSPGFRTAETPLDSATLPLSIKLELAPVIDSVRVVGSAIDVPASRQGGSVSIVPREEIEERNEPSAVDLLRNVPGVAVNQTGATGGVTSLFIRGAASNFALVQVDGVTVNSFGGAFDFAHIPALALDHIELIRGAQSSVYGSYANSGAVNFVTRKPGGAPELELLAEGGSYDERRFGISGAGTFAGFGIAASASRLDTAGQVANDAYRNENLLLNITRAFRRQRITLRGNFDANQAGEPGAWGSDPKHTFFGLDLVSRLKNNFSDYSAHYEAEITPRIREDLTGSLFLNNAGYQSPYGFSFNNDLRGQGESRTIVSVTSHYTAAFGVSAAREEVKNTFLPIDLNRNDIAVYVEDRFEIGRLFLNAGVRGQFITTLEPRKTISQASPKIAAAYILGSATRVHASFGTGLRPPNGFELAYTDNPALRPERTRSVDAGIERTLLHNLLQVDATYFYNRYYDLIVSLGGSLSRLSHYTTDNLANSRSQGLELSSSLRPARWLFVRGSYTLLDTEILSLEGAGNTAPLPFTVGQPLTRRPRNSGEAIAMFTRGRVTADVSGVFRGRALFEEPYLGATNGLFWNTGYSNIGVNVNYALRRGMSVYGNLHNALNRHYEEIFGYPSPRVNFITGVKWTLSRGQ